MIGYKVVTPDLYSVSIELNLLNLRIQYKLGEFVEPIFGPLAVFDTLNHAKDFIKTYLSYNEYHVYTCEFDLSKQQGLLWVRDVDGDIIIKSNLPQGTILADRVKLCEWVEPE